MGNFVCLFLATWGKKCGLLKAREEQVEERRLVGAIRS